MDLDRRALSRLFYYSPDPNRTYEHGFSSRLAEAGVLTDRFGEVVANLRYFNGVGADYGVAIHMAVDHGNVDAVRILCGMDATAVNALINAACLGRYQVVQMLLANWVFPADAILYAEDALQATEDQDRAANIREAIRVLRTENPDPYAIPPS